MLKPSKAVIFDMDGVLIFSEEAQYISSRLALHANFGITLTKEDYETLLHGRTDRDGFLRFLQRYALPVTSIEKLLEDKKVEYIKSYLLEVKPNLNAIQVLKELAQMQFPIALTTSSTRFELNMTVQTFLLDPFLSATVSADDVVNGKPMPEPYLKTASLLHMAPEQCIVIEDTPAGITSAKSANCLCIALTTSNDASLLEDADYIRESLSVKDILEIM